jgi:hypothetical protein
MLNLKRYLNRRLSGRETAIVVLIVAALAGLGYAAYGYISATILEARVRAAVPAVLAMLRAQEWDLEKAIEAYKLNFGFYPPDHVLEGQPPKVDAVKNPLLYELAGVVYNPTNKVFQVGRLEAADAEYVRKFFHSAGFKNCGERAEQVKHFLSLDHLPIGQLHDDPDVFVLAFNGYPEGIAPEVFNQLQISFWRYVSSSPTNNPGRYDLWLDLDANGQTSRVGNWPAAK